LAKILFLFSFESWLLTLHPQLLNQQNTHIFMFY
jgi:hypothetical protein